MNKSKQAYEYLWNSPFADQIDLGASGFFDEFYDLFLSGEHLRERDLSQLTVVDLGAGKGSRLAELLSKRGAQLVAVDWMFEDPAFTLRYPAKRVAADVLESGLESGSADVVISANVLINNSYMAQEETKKLYLEEILRLLKPGGLFWGEEQSLSSALFENHPSVSDYHHFKDYHIHFFVRS